MFLQQFYLDVSNKKDLSSISLPSDTSPSLSDYQQDFLKLKMEYGSGIDVRDSNNYIQNFDQKAFSVEALYYYCELLEEKVINLESRIKELEKNLTSS